MASTQVETRIIEVKVTSTGDAALRQLQAQLDAVAKQYDRAAASTIKMNRAQADSDKQARQSRTAWAGLGQQIQDSAIQWQMGTSALTIFTQQGTQAAYQLQGASGVIGGVARFLSGPWVAAVLAATVVLGPLISEMLGLGEATDETKEAMEDMEKAIQTRKDSEDDLRLALAKTKEAYLAIRLELQEQARTQVNLTQIVLQESLKRLEAAQREQQAITGKITGAGGGRASAEMANAQIINQVMNQRELTQAIEQTRAAVTEAEGATAKWNATRVATANAEEALANERNKRTKKEKDEFAELVKQWRAGSPELFKLKKEAEDLQKVFRAIEGVDWSEQTANTSLLSKTIVETLNKIRALESPLQAVLVEVENQVSAVDELNTQYGLLYQLINDLATDPAVSNWAQQQANDIAFKLMPELKAATDAVDAYLAKSRTTIQDTITTARMGGADKEKASKAITQAGDVLTQARAQGESPEVIKRLTQDLHNAQLAWDELNMSMLESQGLTIAVDTIGALGEGFAAAIEGAESFNKVMKAVAKDLTRELTKLIVKWLILQALMAAMGGTSGPHGKFLTGLQGKLGFAKGGVFDKGVKKFADGGVVGAPTLFGMRGGLGVMGEAGPEAIMPLQRGSNGKLGVAAAPVNIQIINNAGVAVSTRQEDDRTTIILEAVNQSRRAVASDIRKGGNSVAKSFESTYGVNRGR